MDFSAEHLLNDIAIRTAMREALRESQPGTKHPTEQGGFIVRDATTLRPVVRRLSVGQADSFQIEQIIGSFHTHPNIGPE
jgi:hypothetical protein